MAKQQKTAWFCNNCGTESPKWVGRCPGCGEWNTMIGGENCRRAAPKAKCDFRPVAKKRAETHLAGRETVSETRIHMPSEELNRVLGGGELWQAR